MTEKEKALAEFLADKIFASGEEGFNAGWEAAMKEAQSYRFTPMEMYVPSGELVVKEPRANATLQDCIKEAFITTTKAERLAEADALLQAGKFENHEDFQKFLRAYEYISSTT